MRKRGRVAALFLLVVMWGTAPRGALAEIDPADDQDSYILAALAQPAAATFAPDFRSADQARFLLFSTTDLWRHGGFAHGGVLWAPSGLDRDGPVLKLVFGGGVYHYL